MCTQKYYFKGGGGGDMSIVIVLFLVPMFSLGDADPLKSIFKTIRMWIKYTVKRMPGFFHL